MTDETTHIRIRRPEWERQLEAVRAHYAATGSVPYPRPEQPQELERMGQWVLKQRRHFSQGRLAPEFVEELRRVPGLLVARRFTERAEAVLEGAAGERLKGQEEQLDAIRDLAASAETVDSRRLLRILAGDIAA